MLGKLWSLLALAAIIETVPLRAEVVPYQVDNRESLLAVVTHRAGPAARLAHDHLISAPLNRVALELDPQEPEGTVRFTLRFPATELAVDRPEERTWFSPRAVRLGILPEPGLPLISSSDVPKVRKAMLGPEQLDASRFPEVSVELLGLERRGGGSARVGLPWSARVRVALHGTSRELSVPLRYEIVEQGQLTVEAVGEASFSDFGIPPYSAFLGAIRNQDTFHFVAVLRAFPAPKK
jgi:hypothetical protein